MISHFDKNDIAELIAAVRASEDDSELDIESIEQEILEDCESPEDLAQEYNEEFADTEQQQCIVVNAEKWTFSFEDKS